MRNYYPTVMAIGLMALVGCRSLNPTSPTPTKTDGPTASTPAPEPPAPVQEPPANTPKPEPVPPTPQPPAPKPQPELTLKATADGGYWVDPSKDPGKNFRIEVWPDSVVFNGVSLPRDTATPAHMGILATDGHTSVTLQKGQLANQWLWKYSGPAGFASGTAEEK